MEFVIALVVIVVLLVILGVKIETMLAGVVLLGGLLIIAIFLMFAYSFFRLVTSKKTEARVSRLDKSPKSKFKVAYYICDGEEYPCFFPCEPIFHKKLYSTERTYIVRLNSHSKAVFDRSATATCIIGFFFSLAVIASLVMLYICG